MRSHLRHLVIASTLAAGLVAIVLAAVFGLPAMQWLAYSLWMAIPVAVIVRSLSRRGRNRTPVGDASQVVNDAYLGRRPPTPPIISPASSSLAWDRPQDERFVLYENEKRQ